MTEYIENPLSGKLRGITYEDGKIIDVHIRDTDDVVKVFVPVRHGRWIEPKRRAQQEQESKPTNGWISVKDRLPRCGDSVIVTDGVFACEAFLSISGKWVRNGIGWIESEITHWMPMPNLPKGEYK